MQTEYLKTEPFENPNFKTVGFKMAFGIQAPTVQPF